jgi:pyruvate dehydrogenase E2 component (dihydrolipoamide acetyltransferase)
VQAQPAKPAVPAPAAARPAPAAARPAPAAATPAPAPVAVPVIVPADQPTTSLAQRGVAYIVSRESVVESDLRAAMGLSKGRYPSAYLVAAIQAGKVHKDGAIWKAGRAPTAPLDSVVAVGNIVVASKDSSPIPQAVVDAISSPAEERAVAAPPAPADPIFRCGLWSDGVLELQRNGSTVAVLQQAEGEQLASFVNRMLIDPLGLAVQTSTQTR